MNYQGIYYTFSNLFIFSLIYRFSYFCLHNILLFSYKYNTLSISKQRYVVKNIFKSFVLLSLTIKYKTLLSIYNNTINLKNIQFNGAIYVANDFLGLIYLYNHKLSKTTIFHHLTTILLLFIISNIDNKDKLLYKLIYTYTVYSYHAFMVNLYLGVRFLVNENIYMKKLVDIIRVFSFYNYLICCIANLLTHMYLIYIHFNEVNYTIYIYSLIVIPIINDDIILLKWLKKID